MLNGTDHLRELRDLSTAAIGGPPSSPDRLRLDDGERLLATEFTSVVRHDYTSELLIPGPQPVEDYVRSMNFTRAQPDLTAFAAAVARLTSGSGTFRVRTHTGCLVCR